MFILQASSFNNFKIVASILILLFPTVVFGECTCDSEDGAPSNKDEALKYKLGSIASILVFGTVGVSLPLLSKKIPSLRPDKNIFFLIKAFAAGVILATAFIHILPDAFETLTSPCLKENPWGKFPFTGFVCMMSAIGTLMIDSLATGYYKRSSMKTSQVVVDEESIGVHDHHDHGADHAHGHAHTHGSNNAHGSSEVSTADLIRHRVISQVLELGILVHSVIIGISLGASQNPETIKPLLVALSFHQFFEGMGLGGCISQAQFKSFSAAIMAVFFSLTTPVGIAVGIGISHVYSETSPTALIVQGTLEAAAAGILIYMSLVDLLAADFMSPRMQQNAVIQLGSYTSLLLGAGCMSLLAKWA